MSLTEVTAADVRIINTLRAALRLFQENSGGALDLLNIDETDALSEREVDDLLEQIEEHGICDPRCTRLALQLTTDESMLARDRHIAALPPVSYIVLRETGELVKIKRGVTGYFPVSGTITKSAEALNAELGVSGAQAAAMHCGSMFGWHIPAANPAMYDNTGKLNDRVESRQLATPEP